MRFFSVGWLQYWKEKDLSPFEKWKIEVQCSPKAQGLKSPGELNFEDLTPQAQQNTHRNRSVKVKPFALSLSVTLTEWLWV